MSIELCDELNKIVKDKNLDINILGQILTKFSSDNCNQILFVYNKTMEYYKDNINIDQCIDRAIENIIEAYLEMKKIKHKYLYNKDDQNVCKLDECTCAYTEGKCEDMNCESYISLNKEYLIIYEGIDKDTLETVVYHSVRVKAINELEANLKLKDYNCDAENWFKWRIVFTRDLSTIKCIE